MTVGSFLKNCALALWRHTAGSPQKTGERFLEPVSRDAPRRLLDNEIALCQQLHQEHLIPLFQRELDR